MNTTTFAIVNAAMATTRYEIHQWLVKAKENPANTHMLVVCDTFDHEDYPVSVTSREAAEAKLRNPGEMQRVMEVYDLSKDLIEQLTAKIAWNL